VGGVLRPAGAGAGDRTRRAGTAVEDPARSAGLRAAAAAPRRERRPHRADGKGRAQTSPPAGRRPPGSPQGLPPAPGIETRQSEDAVRRVSQESPPPGLRPGGAPKKIAE